MCKLQSFADQLLIHWFVGPIAAIPKIEPTQDERTQAELARAAQEAALRWQQEQMKSAAEVSRLAHTITGVAPLQTGQGQKENTPTLAEQIFEQELQAASKDKEQEDDYEDVEIIELDESLSEDEAWAKAKSEAEARVKADAEQAGSSISSEHWMLDDVFDENFEQRGHYEGVKVVPYD